MDQRSIQETALRDLGGRIAARRKRLGLSLRDASAEVGISFNTLARVEKGHLPDFVNFRRLLAWLGESETSASPEQGSTPDVIAGHLRTDPLLPPDAANRIAGIVKDLYEALAKPPLAAPVHLRSARTFTPDAACELADLLGRMHDRLAAGD